MNRYLPVVSLAILGGIATYVLPHLSGSGVTVGVIVTVLISYFLGIWRGATDET